MFGWISKTSSSGSKTARLKSTKSYVYFPDQTLGNGATSSVYLGRNKKTSEKVAVKVFNASSYHRSEEVQDREFEVLHKLKHENIVRLLAIEDDTGTKQRVLIMELCDYSVLDMLARPEYYYGFQEDEFLGILQDITAGMKYLKDVDIVHRDIKPGNIMRRLGPDKRPSFKLADFGAARELEEGGQFMSLYGTEEYLHPDMYAGALLRKTPDNPLTSRVDLWSLGVTIYHIATGCLPFRPYGGRKNKKTMYEMTSKKVTGVISAVQMNSERGPIKYSKELPTTCHLSQGLKVIVTPLLAGLLESNPVKMLTFQQFFNTTQRIFTMKQIHIFQIEKSQLLKIYSDPDFTLSELQEQIAAQTNIPADQQILAHGGKEFLPEVSVKCYSFPEMPEHAPLMLWKRNKNEKTSDPVLPYAPTMPSFSTTHSLDGDYSSAKSCVAVVIYMALSQRRYFVINELYTLVAETISNIIKSHILELRYHHAKTNGLRASVEILHQNKQQEATNMLTLLQSHLEQSNGNKSDYEDCHERIRSVSEEITEQQDKFNMIEMQFSMVDRLMEELVPYLSSGNLITTWDPGQGCSKADRCSDRLEVFQEEMQNIYEKFGEDRTTARLAYSDEQLHKMAKQKLQEISIQTTSLVQDHCAANLKKLHGNFFKWFLEVSEIEAKVNSLDEQLTPLVEQIAEFHQKTKKLAEQWTTETKETVSKLSALLKEAVPPEIKPLRWSRNHEIQDNNSEIDGPVNDHKPCNVLSRQSSFTTEGEGSERFVSVPRSFAEKFVSTKSQGTDEILKQSRELMVKWESLSVPVVSLNLSDIELSDESDDEYSDTISAV